MTPGDMFDYIERFYSPRRGYLLDLTGTQSNLGTATRQPRGSSSLPFWTASKPL